MYALKKGCQPMIKNHADGLTVEHLDMIIAIKYRMDRDVESDEEQ